MRFVEIFLMDDLQISFYLSVWFALWCPPIHKLDIMYVLGEAAVIHYSYIPPSIFTFFKKGVVIMYESLALCLPQS